MTELQQLVYISRATFASSREGLGVEPEVGRILVQSRLNNPRRGLVGALYYGDGCFFQCLEGNPKDIDALYSALLADPRHRELKVVHRGSIESTSFSHWAMKYVPGASEVRALLKKHGMPRFDPYRFDKQAISDMVDLLHRGMEGSPDPESSGTTRAPRWGRTWVMAGAGIVALIVVLLALLR